jgi:hypothetical protein
MGTLLGATVDLVYSNVPEDVVVFADHAFSRTTQFWRYHLFWLVVGFVLVGLILGLSNLFWPTPCSLLISALAVVGWPLYYSWRAPMRYRDQVRRIYREGGHKDVLGRRMLTADPDRLKARLEQEEAQYPWAEIRRVISIPGYTFIYTTEANAYVIPQLRVESGDYDAFVRAVRQWYAQAHPQAT